MVTVTQDGVLPQSSVMPLSQAVSAVSWAAVIAGAFVAAATSVVLLALGSGFGLATISPWRGAGASIATFTVMAGIWLIVIQWAASGIGGYLTGRLRIRWIGAHTHEVFFRDTAHGFLMWSVSTVIVAVLAASAASFATSDAAHIAGAPSAYAVDTLFRSSRSDETTSAPGIHAEAERILTHLTAPDAAPADRDYLADRVAERAGVTPSEALRRIDACVANMKKAANDARKAASATSIFTALAMLVGAFIACVAAALGGQQRDEHP